MYVSYCFQLLTMWLIWNFCFCAVFSHLSWFEIPHILGVWDIIYMSGDTSDWQIITSMHMYSQYHYSLPYLSYWQMQICGRSKIPQFWKVWNILFWVGRLFAKVTPKAGRVSSIFLLPPEVIWCPPYARGLRYHQPFRGHLRLTNYNFHAHVPHVHYCITIHSYIGIVFTNTDDMSCWPAVVHTLGPG